MELEVYVQYQQMVLVIIETQNNLIIFNWENSSIKAQAVSTGFPWKTSTKNLQKTLVIFCMPILKIQILREQQIVIG